MHFMEKKQKRGCGENELHFMHDFPALSAVHSYIYLACSYKRALPSLHLIPMHIKLDGHHPPSRAFRCAFDEI